jgi:hypothetical protein
MSLPPGDLEGLVASPIAMEGASVLTAKLTATAVACLPTGWSQWTRVTPGMDRDLL